MLLGVSGFLFYSCICFSWPVWSSLLLWCVYSITVEPAGRMWTHWWGQTQGQSALSEQGEPSPGSSSLRGQHVTTHSNSTGFVMRSTTIQFIPGWKIKTNRLKTILHNVWNKQQLNDITPHYLLTILNCFHSEMFILFHSNAKQNIA